MGKIKKKRYTIEKISMNTGFDTVDTKDVFAMDSLSATAGLKIMGKINEIIDRLNKE